MVVCCLVCCLTNFFQSKQVLTETNAVVRTIEINKNVIDYQSVLDEFDDSKLETDGSLTTFVGFKSIDLAELDGFDLVSGTDLENTEVSVKYNFSYDNETNIVTLSAELMDENGEIHIDRLTGAAFVNDYGEIDAVMNVDGEGILLSEMKDSGMIANCGWFSRLIKRIVKVVIVAAVVAVAAAVVVATAGAAAPAVVAAGVGAIGTGASAAGAAITAGVAAAAITAGVGTSIAVGKTIAEVKDEVKESTRTNEKKKNNIIFPYVPETFAPRGLVMRMYPGTSNGRFIKWFNTAGVMIFEWDEDLTNGSHYHIMSHDGAHYLPGTNVPEPYASMYF